MLKGYQSNVRMRMLCDKPTTDPLRFHVVVVDQPDKLTLVAAGCREVVCQSRFHCGIAAEDRLHDAHEPYVFRGCGHRTAKETDHGPVLPGAFRDHQHCERDHSVTATPGNQALLHTVG